MKRTLAFLCCALGLSACSDVPFATRAAFDGLDVFSADVADMRVIVEHPSNIPLDVAATLRFGFDSPGGGLEEAFELDRAEAPVETIGQTRVRYVIAPEDRRRFREAQQSIQDLKSTYPDDSSGSLSVDASGCLTGPATGDRVPISVYVAFTGSGPLMPVLEQQDLSTLARSAGVDGLGLCPDA